MRARYHILFEYLHCFSYHCHMILLQHCNCILHLYIFTHSSNHFIFVDLISHHVFNFVVATIYFIPYNFMFFFLQHYVAFVYRMSYWVDIKLNCICLILFCSIFCVTWNIKSNRFYSFLFFLLFPMFMTCFFFIFITW